MQTVRRRRLLFFYNKTVHLLWKAENGYGPMGQIQGVDSKKSGSLITIVILTCFWVSPFFFKIFSFLLSPKCWSEPFIPLKSPKWLGAKFQLLIHHVFWENRKKTQTNLYSFFGLLWTPNRSSSLEGWKWLGGQIWGLDSSWILRTLWKHSEYSVNGAIPLWSPNMECDDSSPQKSSLRIA